MLLRSPTRKYRTALAGGAATVLAAIAIAAPASAAVDYFHVASQAPSAATSSGSDARLSVPDAPDRGQDSSLPAVQDAAFNFSRPGG